MPLIVTGVRETIRSVGRTVLNDGVKIAAAQQQFAMEVLALSNHYVPKDTMALHDSGRVETHGRGFGAKTTVEYGGEAPGHDVIVDYAAVVHNDLEAFHDPPTCAMYLSRATVELSPRYAQIVGRTMKTTGVVGVEGLNRFGFTAADMNIPSRFSGGSILPDNMRG